MSALRRLALFVTLALALVVGHARPQRGTLDVALEVAAAQAAPAFTGPSGPLVTVAPLGGGLDDGPRLTAALARGPVQAIAAVYTIHTPILVSSAARFEGHPGGALKSTMAGHGVGGTANSVFLGVLGAVTSPFLATLTSDTVGGSPVIHCDGKPAVGTWVELTGAASNVGQIAQVVAATGNSSPYTVTLDAGVGWPGVFVTGATVGQVNPVVGAILHGNGMTISGTGDRAIEGNWIGGEATGFNIDGRYGYFDSIIASADIGSRRFRFGNITIEAGGHSAAGLGLESCQGCRIDGAQIAHVGASSSQPGVFLADSVDCDVLADTDGCAVGVHAVTGSNSTTGTGTRRTRISGSYNGSTYYGAIVASPEVDLLGASFSFNAVGVQVSHGAAAGAPVGGAARLVGVRTTGNAGAGVSVNAGDVVIEGLVSRDDGITTGNHAVEIGGTGATSIVGGSVELSADHFVYMIYASGSGPIWLGGGLRLTLPSAHSNSHAGIVVDTTSTSVVSIGDTTITNGVYGLYVYGGGATIRRRPGFVLVGAFTGADVTITAGSYASWGTVTLNGTSGVDVTFPDAKATDTLVLTRKSAGSTTSISPIWSVTAGSKFTITGPVSSANDVIGYWLQSVCPPQLLLAAAALCQRLRRRQPANDNADRKAA